MLVKRQIDIAFPQWKSFSVCTVDIAASGKLSTAMQNISRV